MKQLRLILACTLASISCFAQKDTIRVCSYNILNYGNTNNSVGYKNPRLQAILQEIRPHITCFNEISASVPGLLDSLLQVMPFPSEHGPVHNTTSTNQLDGLFWQQGRFRLLRDSIISNLIRDIVSYELYYDYPGLARYRDTLRIFVITAHLKSSNAASDRAERALETQKVALYLAGLKDSSNVIMLGDLNLYTSAELAYQNLTNTSDSNKRLNDPVGRPGAWDNNPAFADLHTQSPRVLQLPDGGASGGLDSRFDFVLASNAAMDGSMGLRYIPGSYSSFGNDGMHYGRSLIDTPANTAVSPAIALALYECSDHLPVFGSFEITPLHILYPTSVTQAPASMQDLVRVANPFANTIRIHVNGEEINGPLHYQLYTIDGRILQQGIFPLPQQELHIHTDLSPGIYFLRLWDTHKAAAFFKLSHN